MKKSLTQALLSFALFGILILLLRTVDVLPDTFGNPLGLSSLNHAFFDLVGASPLAERISEITGLSLFLFPLAFALLGAWRLVKNRSFAAVGSELYLLAGLYVAMAIFYVGFEAFPFNYRPMLEGMTQAEASFPSSHTLMAVVFGFSTPAVLPFVSIKSWQKASLGTVSITFAILTVLMRALSGRHWLTDIIGGILLGFALVFAYQTALSAVRSKEESHA